MGIVRRRQLRRPAEVSDEQLLRSAQAAATRAARRLERERLVDAVNAESRRAERSLARSRVGGADHV